MSKAILEHLYYVADCGHHPCEPISEVVIARNGRRWLIDGYLRREISTCLYFHPPPFSRKPKTSDYVIVFQKSRMDEFEGGKL